ncbi:hypothetical protein [Streptomyces alboniger]|uniref:hypothetical protein n=1 Tax=Streptomyces alboniger TaxID=132473 RepID=UPI000AE47BC9|nr:hypothetical protein [Streptomyces alboniger]
MAERRGDGGVGGRRYGGGGAGRLAAGRFGQRGRRGAQPSAGRGGGARGAGQGLAQGPPPARKPSGTPPSRPRATPSPERSTVRFTGGAATAECRPDGTVRLVSWSPADGFHIDDDVERGPAAVARLEAEPGDDDEREDLVYEIRCTEQGPRARVTPDRDED